MIKADKKVAQLTIEELKQNLWIEMGTRVVFIDFTVYNANMNMFAVVKLVFEFPAAGGDLPTPFYTGSFFVCLCLSLISQPQVASFPLLFTPG